MSACDHPLDGHTTHGPWCATPERPERYQRLVVPLRPHVEAELFVPFPMTTGDWDQFMMVLIAMKPGLVKEERDHAD
jgi:hypothetical protein